ncbi:MAG: PorT family protein [Ignavibacteriaceae bacterium]|nr:PorT family protein [Ignavibacteriaceae bacterium]
MKKLTAIFALFLIGATLSFAQVNANYDGPTPEVRQGAKSFVFLYTPFQSNLNPVYVSPVSVFPDEEMDLVGAGFRYFVTNEIALGVGLNFGTGTSEREFPNGDKEELSLSSFGVAIDANYHFKSLYSVSPYVGIHANFGSVSYEFDETIEGITTTEEASGTGLGAGLNFGFDWFFTEGLSLGGKYTIGFQSLGKPELKSGSVSVEGASSSLFGISSASVILNVHF